MQLYRLIISHRYDFFLRESVNTMMQSGRAPVSFNNNEPQTPRELKMEYYETLLNALLEKANETNGVANLAMHILDLEKMFINKSDAKRSRARELVVEELSKFGLTDEEIFG